ncbi:ATP-binding protein [Frondihabitans sp. 762G35]|uniref:ATP-binding protein n=1 Tax=Frondihabitans sp. 762G35 TaxID=1446794 RepID=UPI000E706A30|nr:ATP-binding protein [Frondihabitans sp. 762G35]
MTLRLRLTITYAVLVVLTGFSVLAAVAVVLLLIPGYAFTSSQYPSGVLGTPSIMVSNKRDLLELLAVVAVPVLVLVGGIGAAVGWFVAGRALKPLTDIVRTARTLDGASIDRRIALDGPEDEVRVLADTIDGMLDRLEAAFAVQGRFAANVSHELRTPLTTTKTLLQVASRSEQTPEVEQLLYRLSITNDRTIDITRALLDLAGSNRIDHAENVDLAELARRELADQSETIDDEALVVTEVLRSATVVGHPVLLQLLVRNLVQNAVRHNRRGGDLHVAVGREPGGVVLRVSNSGPRIEEATVPLLTEAFHRTALRTASGAATGGHGLGLALVKSIVETHDARLLLQAGRPDGLVVEVVFPGGGPLENISKSANARETGPLLN